MSHLPFDLKAAKQQYFKKKFKAKMEAKNKTRKQNPTSHVITPEYGHDPPHKTSNRIKLKDGEKLIPLTDFD